MASVGLGRWRWRKLTSGPRSAAIYGGGVGGRYVVGDDTNWPVLILAELDLGMIYAGHSPLCRRGTRYQLHELFVGCIYCSDDLVHPGTHVYLSEKADPVELTKLIVSVLEEPRRGTFPDVRVDQ